jgi:hypothetical protein
MKLNVFLSKLFALVLIGTILFGGMQGIARVSAQDATSEPTAESTPVVTAEAPTDITVEDGGTLVINEQPTTPPDTAISTDNLLKLAMAILAGIVGGGSILMVLDRFIRSKEVKDALENIYVGSPVETQEGLLKALDTVDNVVNQLVRIVQFGREVTDKQPNIETPIEPGK